MPIILTRPEKLDHIQTIHYEISMLRFTASRLIKREFLERDAWVYLEAFLLHYRNLIEFLGNDKPRSTDLHVTTIWQLMNLTPPPTLKEIHAKGKALMAKYEPSDAQGGGRISQYLQHCTIRRTVPKEWQIDTMVNEIEPLLLEVQKHLGTDRGILVAVPAAGRLDPFSASTTVATSTSAAAVRLDSSVERDYE